MRTPKQTDPQFKLRLTPELDAAIERAASESGRTKNAEILYRLGLSFRISPNIEELVEVLAKWPEKAKRLADGLIHGSNIRDVVFLPTGLWGRIEAEAEKSHRTANSEAVMRLEEAFPVLDGITYREITSAIRKTLEKQGDKADPDVRAFVEGMEKRIKEDPSFGDQRPPTGQRVDV